MDGLLGRCIISLFLLMSCQLNTNQWIDTIPGTLTGFVYAPGMLGSEILMGRYCPKFVASTGELITCSKGIEVIRMPARSCNFTEITLKKTKKAARKARRHNRSVQKKSAKRVFINLLMIPVHMTSYLLSYLYNVAFGLNIERSKEYKSEESLSRYCADPTKLCLAQEKDLAIFKQAYDDFVVTLGEENHKKSIVLYGKSRGAATVFNFTALEHPKEVNAIVCEGLFDSIEHVKVAAPSRLVRWISSILHKISHFDHKGVVPIKLVEQIPKDMPVLLITSHNDAIVPYACTMNVYNQLRMTGHNKVHILVLKKASHTSYSHGDKQETKLYENIVHAYYKKYGLPHIAEYAHEGEEYFNTMTQPEVHLFKK